MKTAWLRIFHPIALILAFAFFLSGSLLLNLYACFLPPGIAKLHYPNHLHRLSASYLRIYLSIIRKAGLCRFSFPEWDPSPSTTGTLIVANHGGLMDAVFFLGLVPRLFCIYKSGLDKNPFVSRLIRRIGHIPNNRGIDTIHDGVQIIRSGSNLLVFPEGTRNSPSQDISFQSGFAMIAHRAKCDILMIALRNEQRVFSKEKGWMPPMSPFTYHFEIIGTVRFDPERTPKDLAIHVAERYRAYFRANETGIRKMD